MRLVLGVSSVSLAVETSASVFSTFLVRVRLGFSDSDSADFFLRVRFGFNSVSSDFTSVSDSVTVNSLAVSVVFFGGIYTSPRLRFSDYSYFTILKKSLQQ